MYCICVDRSLWEVKGAWSLEWRGLVSSSWAHTQHVHLEILIFDDTLLKGLLRRVEVLEVRMGMELLGEALYRQLETS